MNTPQIIRTRDELGDLNADTLLVTRDSETWIAEHVFVSDLPAVVIATGNQVRAAREALEEQA